MQFDMKIEYEEAVALLAVLRKAVFSGLTDDESQALENFILAMELRIGRGV